MTPKRKKRRFQDGTDVPLFRPKTIRHHVADEYEEAGDERTAAELRRCLRGRSGRFVELATAWMPERKEAA